MSAAKAKASSEMKLFRSKLRQLKEAEGEAAILEIAHKGREVSVARKSGATAAKKPRSPSARKMLEWFRANHTPAASSSPTDENDDDACALVDVRDALERQFPNGSDRIITKVSQELNAEDSWLSDEQFN